MYICLRVKYPLFFLIFMKLEFSRQILEISSNTKFHENPFSSRRAVPCGQTDRHDEANIRVSQFYKKRRNPEQT